MRAMDSMSMANATISCVKEITKNVPITLSISYHGNEITGISDVLENWKRQHIQMLQGIVVNYKNVSLLSKFAYIKLDNPVILCNVKATFELFTPSIGSIVKGVVNRISHDYIGCLVHNTINVTINRFHNASDASSYIALDKEILFEITHLGFERKVIKVKGKITQDCVNLMEELNFSTVESTSTSNNRVIYSSNEYSDGSNDANTASDSLFNDVALVGKTSDYSSDLGSYSPKKKSKKSKKEINTSSFHESITENYDESQSLLDNSSRLTAEYLSDISHDSSKKKKKKSKKRDRSELSVDDLSETSSNQINADHSILLNEDISPKKKKLKKSTSNVVEKNLVLNISEPQNLDDNSSETSSQSTSSKVKKHKKSNKDILSSPSIFSDSLSSKDEIELFKMPITPPKKKKEKSPVKFSPSKAVNNMKSLASLHETYEDTPSDLLTSTSSLKLNQEFSPLDDLTISSSLLNQTTKTHFSHNNSVLNEDKSSIKKAKKRKLESSGKDGLPKKKKKLDSNSSKHKGDKSKKKNKDKSKKRSKKDKKKKSKHKVISSKKKLPKLKKKERTGKLKNKSKHKKKDVP